jgi:hypothetical protein
MALVRRGNKDIEATTAFLIYPIARFFSCYEIV